MPDQPNPFVNPNQRGVELPAGCKDLNDTLGRAGVGALFRGTERPIRGTVWDVREYVRQLTECRDGEQAVLIACPNRAAVVILSGSEGKVSISLLVRGGDGYLRRAVEEMFGEGVFKEVKPGVESVVAALPAWWDSAGQVVIDLLIRGYGLEEGSQIWFSVTQKKGLAKRLPAEHADLKVVLKVEPKRETSGISRMATGDLTKLKSYVRDLYELEPSGRALFVYCDKKRVVLMLVRRADGFSMSCLLQGQPSAAAAIAEIFGDTTATHSLKAGDVTGTVSISLPSHWEDAVEVIVPLLIRGFGVGEGTELVLHFGGIENRE